MAHVMIGINEFVNPETGEILRTPAGMGPGDLVPHTPEYGLKFRRQAHLRELTPEQYQTFVRQLDNANRQTLR